MGRRINQMLHQLRRGGSNGIEIVVTNAIDDVQDAITEIVECELKYVVEDSFGQMRADVGKSLKRIFHGRVQEPSRLLGK